MERTIATLFGGGGGVELGAILAGVRPIWSVELDPAIAEVHEANIKSRVIARSVLDVDPYSVERPDILHASPPCPSFSVANVNKGETALDIAMAEAVCSFIRVLTPEVFTLENVMGYRKSQSYGRIVDTLLSLGYYATQDIVNAADYGVPQTRKRLFLTACRGAMPPPLPAKGKWVGWYEAIEDLLPTLPESRFADWQLARLPDDYVSALVNCQNKGAAQGRLHRRAGEPSMTVLYGNNTKPRAFLVGDQHSHAGQGVMTRHAAQPATTTDTRRATKTKAFLIDGKPANFDGDLQVSGLAEPTPTLTASQEKHPFRAFLCRVQGENSHLPVHAEHPAPHVTTAHSPEKHRAWLSQGRVVAMTARALARFQSVPDTYELPPCGLATKIIGNMVPPKMYEAVLRGL